MRLVHLFILVQGIEPVRSKSSRKSPILLRLRQQNPSIPATLVLLRPNREHLRLPRVQAHLRRPLPRPGSLPVAEFISDLRAPPWPSSPSFASSTSKHDAPRSVQPVSSNVVILRTELLHFGQSRSKINITSRPAGSADGPSPVLSDAACSPRGPNLPIADAQQIRPRALQVSSSDIGSDKEDQHTKAPEQCRGGCRVDSARLLLRQRFLQVPLLH
ncbi:uncharacterized protein LOC124696316 [Lolium rigidum]|uniref:uncharacterized protein LOC124696316 n=1 Tax=Lolium rigidum TaxID=89674 RepID=UPI001F5CF5E9|nr:uncharacterized protein LOC124696316 [Lolium rigidum]